MMDLKTKVNPYQFEIELGKLRNIYTTTISSLTFVLSTFSFLILLIGIAKSIQLMNNFGFAFFMWTGISFLMIFSLIYYILAIRFCYIATFENGVVIKERYKTRVVKYKEIKKIELQNLSILQNLFRTDNSKKIAIEITLNHSNIILIGESHRIFKSISYPRIPRFTRVLNIKDLYKEIESTVHNTV